MITVHIEFISDFICPWCYIAKARLERLAKMVSNDLQIEVELLPYVLYPFIPKGGTPKSDFAKKVKPGMGRSLKTEATLEGIAINYKLIETIPYSFEAHRLMALIPDYNLKYDLAKKIFQAYFEKGFNIEDHPLLCELALECGVENKILSAFQNSDAGFDDCQQSIAKIRDEYIRVVPSLRLDHQFLIPGLQSIDVWENYVRRAAEIQLRG